MRLWLNSTSGSTIALRISGVGASVSVILGIIGSTPSDVPQRRASLPRAPSGPQSCHEERVDVLSEAKGVPTSGSLGVEAELLVEPDRRLVIDIHRQFEPLQIKPIVGDVDERSHQRRADAAPLEIIMDGHADLADMAAPSLVLEDVGRTDDAPVKHCDDSGPFLGRIF